MKSHPNLSESFLFKDNYIYEIEILKKPPVLPYNKLIKAGETSTNSTM